MRFFTVAAWMEPGMERSCAPLLAMLLTLSSNAGAQAGFAAQSAAAGPAQSTAAATPALTATTLQRLLQSTPRHDVRFSESRESPWLSAPVTSTGTLNSTPAMLEKRVEKPQRVTWRILEDRMQRVSPESGDTRDILFNDAPAAAALGHAMLAAMAGELGALEKDFRLDISGDEHAWSVQLTPRRAEVSRFLKQIELQGSRGRLQVLVILESKGDRSITRLLYDE